MNKIFNSEKQANAFRNKANKEGKATYKYKMSNGKFKIYTYGTKKITKKYIPKRTTTKYVPKKITKKYIPKKTKNVDMNKFYQDNIEKAWPKRYSQSDNTVDFVVDRYNDIFQKKYKRSMTDKEYATLEDGVWNGVAILRAIYTMKAQMENKSFKGGWGSANPESLIEDACNGLMTLIEERKIVDDTSEVVE